MKLAFLIAIALSLSSCLLTSCVSYGGPPITFSGGYGGLFDYSVTIQGGKQPVQVQK